MRSGGLTVSTIALLATLGTAFPSPNAQNAQPGDPCAQRLRRLGQLCLFYAAEHGGKTPPSLSILYYQAYETDLSAFVCPESGNAIPGRDEIDAKSDFVLASQAFGSGAKPLLRDRSPENHRGSGINEFWSDGSVHWQAAAAFQAVTPARQQAHVPVPPASTARPPSGASGALSKSRFGVLVGPPGGQGAKIVDVMEPSPAGRAGLRPGDLILAIGDKEFDTGPVSPGEFGAFVSSLAPAKPVSVLVQRGDLKFETAITPEKVVLDLEKASRARSAYDRGRKLMEARDYAGAVRCFDEAMSNDPHQPAIYSALAEAHFRRGDSAAEIEALQKGTAAAPSYNLYILSGSAYRRANRFDEGIEALAKAVSLMPQDKPDARVHEQLGYCYLKTRRFREALSSFESAHQASPRSPAAVYFLGCCHDVLKNPAEAIRWFQAYLDLRHGDENWNAFARDRLEELKRGPQARSKTREQLLIFLDAFVDGLQRATGGPSGPGTPRLPASPRSDAGAGVSGEWSWFDGSSVLIRDDGTFSTSKRLTGIWRLTDPRRRRYTLVWSHGATDTLVLSADGRRLDGTNERGTRVWGERRA